MECHGIKGSNSTDNYYPAWINGEEVVEVADQFSTNAIRAVWADALAAGVTQNMHSMTLENSSATFYYDCIEEQRDCYFSRSLTRENKSRVGLTDTELKAEGQLPYDLSRITPDEMANKYSQLLSLNWPGSEFSSVAIENRRGTESTPGPGGIWLVAYSLGRQVPVAEMKLLD